MSPTVHVGSPNEWQRILGSSTVVVADFYADWCGPCKMIAPTFESLSTKYSKPGKITFCKVDVDSQQSIAQAHGVRAMPTFLVFKSGSVIETIQGANPPALTNAVEKAVKLAGTSAPGASFKTPGRTLGGTSASPSGATLARRGGQTLSGRTFGLFSILSAILTFFGLYFTSLFSFDPYKAAENSDFNVNKPRAPPQPIQAKGQKPGGAARSSGAQGPCPQCRTRLLYLFENGFAGRRSDPLRCRPRPTPSTIRSLRTFTLSQRKRYGSARLFSESRRRHQDVQPEPKPEPQPEPSAQELQEIELTVRQAKQAFGDTLPKGYLTEREYVLYERLYGPPLRETRPEDVGIPTDDIDPVELAEKLAQTILVQEAAEGQVEESASTAGDQVEEFVSAAAETPTPLPTNTGHTPNVQLPDLEVLPELPSDAGLVHINAIAKSQREFDVLLKLQKDFEKSRIQAIEEEEGVEEEEEKEEEEDPEEEEGDSQPDVLFDSMADRVHEWTKLGHWRTSPTTVHLPKQDFVYPISELLNRTDISHVREAAEKVFGGLGLPHSVATPMMKNIPQLGVALGAGLHKMTEINADAFLAANLPGMYASVMGILVEVRKRLGSEWLSKLLVRGEGEGPRVLDVGGGGAGLVAWEQVLTAEWELKFGGGEGNTTPTPPLPGKKTAVVGSDHLRHRISRFLHNTTFLPRLPDYLHSGGGTESLDTGDKTLPRKSFDVIIASHLFMPLKLEYQRKDLLDNLWELLSPDGGVLIVLEKGHPRGFEAVADVRSRLLTEFIFPVNSGPRPEAIEVGGRRIQEPGMIIAPCTNHKQCPMYLTPGRSGGRKDFCHFSQRYIRPLFLQKLLGASHRNHGDVDFSFVAIQRGTVPKAEEASPFLASKYDFTAQAFRGYEKATTAPDPLTLPRNIMPPLKRRGHVTMDLCTPMGTIERWTVPKSFSLVAYHDARKAQWGDLWALGAKTRVARPVRLGKGGVAPNDGGVRSRQAALGRQQVIEFNADERGIYSTTGIGGQYRPPTPRRTKGGRKPRMTEDLLRELELEAEAEDEAEL
ncbi:mitochondrial small ribosomal subunit Rsm22-domain-containing protein [Durotheca rogersii]|uniref:mitochondrial small ribosomal subunit Rsm22-domain-containing protein n=1 Tax=Durotheca rogersii TaxID=419775 RepID=UPI00221F1B37|nr:mitochondrial small ribosomal subunit Rsm22-domain-containing protein [Durotheca rogersii]KAI5867558.1 mitochondrial small ribosomal subunit Rsm22-domain-containing protein [Durotheca rogersii]